MQFVLVVDRRHLFPGLSPQGFLPPAAVDLRAMETQAFFAERGYMERCSHFKQIIPYMVLHHEGHVLCYQRRAAHTESRLGGLWTVGFGGHIEPLDRHHEDVSEIGLLATAALRELAEETGLVLPPAALRHRGFVNGEGEEVSSVHFGVVYSVDLSRLGASRTEIARQVVDQAEPHQALWRAAAELSPPEVAGGGPQDGGRWEDWTRLVLQGLDLS